MRKYILIDTENVNLSSLKGIEHLDVNDCVILFLSNHSELHYLNSRLNKLNYRCKLQKIHIQTGTKNSLDFQLVTYLGMLIGEHKHLKIEDNEYYIVSRDQGFISSINLLKSCEVNVELIPSMIYALNNDEIILRNKRIVQEEILYKELYWKFRPVTVQKILAASEDCSNIEELKVALLKAFNYNPCVYNQVKPYFNTYYSALKIA